MLIMLLGGDPARESGKVGDPGAGGGPARSRRDASVKPVKQDMAEGVGDGGRMLRRLLPPGRGGRFQPKSGSGGMGQTGGAAELVALKPS